MTLPHRLIIDGVEQCASDDMNEFLRMAYLYLDDECMKNVKMIINPSYKEEVEEVDGGVPRNGWCHEGYPEDDE